MHSDFPCKFYYLGMTDHDRSTCKFAHGRPLTDQLRNILLKHLETAPKEILGDFRRINRDKAVHMLGVQHQKLLVEFGMVAPPPPGGNDVKETIEDQRDKGSGRRQSRWCDQTQSGNNYQDKMEEDEPKPFARSLQSLQGIISSDQVGRLVSIGVESVDQINQMTVAQLNEIGLSISQIHEIQLNALQDNKPHSTVTDDFDMRLQTPLIEKNQPFDVDMRRLPDIETHNQHAAVVDQTKSHPNAASAYDYSQYVKDSHICAEEDEEEKSLNQTHKKIEHKEIEINVQSTESTLPLPAVYDPLSALYPSSLPNKIDLSSSVTQLIKETSDSVSYASRSDLHDTKDAQLQKPSELTPALTTFEFFNRPAEDSTVAPCSLDQLLPEKPISTLPIPSVVETNFGIYDYTPQTSSSSSNAPEKQPSSTSPPAAYSPWASSSHILNPNPKSNFIPSNEDDTSVNEADDDVDDEFMDEDDEEPENQFRVADAIFANVTNFSSKDKDMRMASAPLFMTDKYPQRNGDTDLRLPFKPVMENYIPAKEIEASFGSHPLISYKVSTLGIRKNRSVGSFCGELPNQLY